jgi:hypothetical protein
MKGYECLAEVLFHCSKDYGKLMSVASCFILDKNSSLSYLIALNMRIHSHVTSKHEIMIV